MHKVIIIGAGFGGLSAAFWLRKFDKDIEVTLIDRQGKFNFLPMFPDIIGRGINPEFLINSLKDLSKNLGFKFIPEEVLRVDSEKREVFIPYQTLSYDYLIIACGSETNFYGNENIKKYAYKLDNIQDAKDILDVLEKRDFDSYVIAGGGYTGIEIATNLRIYLNKRFKAKRIIIVERAPSILGPLPEWMKDYVLENLKALNIEVSVNTVIDKIEENRIVLSKKEVFDNTLLVWAAGVKIADFVQKLSEDRTSQGRIKVDEYLRLNNHCFVIGDAANFLYQEKSLRMAVQFAIFQGRAAATNINNLILGLPLKKYKPVDLGYIIPMANNKSCGIILGMELKGFLPTFLHFFMCIYRSYGLKNKSGIMRDLIEGGAG